MSTVQRGEYSEPGSVRFAIIQDFKENPRKCTARPLRSLPGFEFVRLPRPRPREAPFIVPGGIWLETDAPPLGPEDRSLLEGGGRVIVLDSSWVRLGPLSRRLRVADGARVESRSLPGGLVTAYPRRSKLFDDPGAGLATVEAIFAVTVTLGEPRPEVLEGYRWASVFLRLNEEAFHGLGWAPPAGPSREGRTR